MKYFSSLLLLALGLLLIASCGEDPQPTPQYTVTEVNITASGRADEPELVAKIKVKNNATTELALTWIRSNVQIPSGWETAICDHNICYPPDTDTRPLVLTAGQEVELKFNFYPDNVTGSGSADLILFETADRTNTEQTVSFTATAN